MNKKKEQDMSQTPHIQYTSNQDALPSNNAHMPQFSAILKKRKFSEALELDNSSSDSVSECA